MVHNGIEYGLMAAYAEGLNILKHADAGLRQREASAEITPLRDPELYQWEIDVPAVTEVWRCGSVVASWLLGLAAEAFNPNGWVSPWHYGINQGPIIPMIENYRTGLVWRLMRHCPYVVTGLRRAGFTGGWL